MRFIVPSDDDGLWDGIAVHIKPYAELRRNPDFVPVWGKGFAYNSFIVIRIILRPVNLGGIKNV